MNKTLFLFIFSSRPDGYINAIAHSYEYMHVEAVKVVYVKEAKTGLSDFEAISTSNQIWARLEELTSAADIYKRLNERLLDRHLVPISYSNLKDELNRLIKQHGGPDNCIIDLTGATKAPSIEVFSEAI